MKIKKLALAFLATFYNVIFFVSYNYHFYLKFLIFRAREKRALLLRVRGREREREINFTDVADCFVSGAIIKSRSYSQLEIMWTKLVSQS